MINTLICQISYLVLATVLGNKHPQAKTFINIRGTDTEVVIALNGAKTIGNKPIPTKSQLSSAALHALYYKKHRL